MFSIALERTNYDKNLLGGDSYLNLQKNELMMELTDDTESSLVVRIKHNVW
jgi:hypothetical protein